jgi:hypothetical protein
VPGSTSKAFLPSRRRISWRFWLACLAAAGGALALVLLLRQPAFDERALRRVADVFERLTEGFSRGRLSYPLQPGPEAWRELEYLEGLPSALDPRTRGCAPTALALEERSRAFRAGARAPSLFQHAARLAQAQEGQDFVHGLSGQIPESAFRLGPDQQEVPSEPEERLRLLQERTDRMTIAARALAALRRSLVAAEEFSETCRAEGAAARAALDYLLAP